MAGYLELYYSGVIFSKKNSKQIISVNGRPIIVSNKNAKKNEKDMAAEFALQAIKQQWHPRGQYAISMYFWRDKNIRRDLDNLATSVLDALVLAQVLEDDSVKYINELHIYDMGVSKELAGVSVHLDGVPYEVQQND